MSGSGTKAKQIQQIFEALETAMGPQHWWPAGSAFEVVVGAYLTQNTAWTNVERAMENLRDAGALSISGIRSISSEKLELLVRPAGYFRQKAARLKIFVAHLDAHYGGSLAAMFGRPAEELRAELLGLTGIGPETADSILLYAACGEVFVVDSYTRRIFERHGLAKAETRYEEIRLEVQKALTEESQLPLNKARCDHKDQPHEQGQLPHLNAANPEARREGRAPDSPPPEAAAPEAEGAGGRGLATHAPSAASAMNRSELSRRYNEFHALLVQTAKHYCVKAEPKCERCPLNRLLPPKRRSG
jgi:endonuclease-3 related protein